MREMLLLPRPYKIFPSIFNKEKIFEEHESLDCCGMPCIYSYSSTCFLISLLLLCESFQVINYNIKCYISYLSSF